MHMKDDVVEELDRKIERLTAVDDGPVAATGMHVMLVDVWVPAELSIWRSWVGRRALWGQEYHGPVFSVEAKDDSVPWTGKRQCTCPTCQRHVAPESRPN